MTQLNDSLLFMEFMDLLVFLKTYTVQKTREISSEVKEFNDTEVSDIQCRVILYNTYGPELIRDFLDYFSQWINIDSRKVNLQKYQTGSTLFEFFIGTSVKVAKVITFLKFFLSEIKLIWTKWRELRDNIASKTPQLGQPKHDRSNKESNASSKGLVITGEHPSKILKESVENPELVKNQNLLNAIGDQLLNIEGPAEVQIALEIKVNKT